MYIACASFCIPKMYCFFSTSGPSRQQSTTEEPPTVIIVRNLPPTASEQYLEMYFENTKRQGGGPVKTVEFDQEDSTALVEFEDPECKFSHSAIMHKFIRKTCPCNIFKYTPFYPTFI